MNHLPSSVKATSQFIRHRGAVTDPTLVVSDILKHPETKFLLSIFP